MSPSLFLGDQPEGPEDEVRGFDIIDHAHIINTTIHFDH
jgi:hypothetical protein